MTDDSILRIKLKVDSYAWCLLIIYAIVGFHVSHRNWSGHPVNQGHSVCVN